MNNPFIRNPVVPESTCPWRAPDLSSRQFRSRRRLVRQRSCQAGAWLAGGTSHDVGNGGACPQSPWHDTATRHQPGIRGFQHSRSPAGRVAIFHGLQKKFQRSPTIGARPHQYTGTPVPAPAGAARMTARPAVPSGVPASCGTAHCGGGVPAGPGSARCGAP
jgi:hypothetical protein